jgi:hypothetical protein
MKTPFGVNILYDKNSINGERVVFNGKRGTNFPEKKKVCPKSLQLRTNSGTIMRIYKRGKGFYEFYLFIT